MYLPILHSPLIAFLENISDQKVTLSSASLYIYDVKVSTHVWLSNGNHDMSTEHGVEYRTGGYHRQVPFDSTSTGGALDLSNCGPLFSVLNDQHKNVHWWYSTQPRPFTGGECRALSTLPASRGRRTQCSALKFSKCTAWVGRRRQPGQCMVIFICEWAWLPIDSWKWRLKTRERTTRDQVAAVDNARTFGINHSDKFRSRARCFCLGLLLFNFFLRRYLLFCTTAGEQRFRWQSSAKIYAKSVSSYDTQS